MFRKHRLLINNSNFSLFFLRGPQDFTVQKHNKNIKSDVSCNGNNLLLTSKLKDK